MAAVMRILGWKAQGLRCPDHEIICQDDTGNPQRVTLVQMPNGTGKTTTLELLRAALSGSATNNNWDPHKVREYCKKNGAHAYGLFEVKLLLNERRVTIQMDFDFDAGRINYKTTHTSGQGGQRHGFHPPYGFQKFMDHEFVNFYAFDGELAESLLDKTESDAEMVVEHLFQINSLRILSNKVDEYWDRKTQSVNATHERGLNRRRNRLEKLKKRYRKLKTERNKLQNARLGVSTKLEEKNQLYQDEINKEKHRARQLTNAEIKANGMAAQVNQQALDVLEQMRDPHTIASHFAEEIMELKSGLDRAKLPESAAREFFEELATETDCVCGRPIDDEISNTIKSRASHYLGSDDVALLNSMKSDIQDAVHAPIGDSSNELKLKLAHLKQTMLEERAAQTDYDELRIAAEKSEPSVAQARIDIEALSGELERIDGELEKFEDKDTKLNDDRTFGIEIITNRIADAEYKLAEITQTIELRTKRDILKRILSGAYEQARTDISRDICTEANGRINELMPHNNIQIDRIERCLVLKGQEGGSAGETLSVAWGFLATLFHRTEHELPFVVDSPAGAIDLAIRPKIGELIPHLTGQFIAFTISSERARFVKPLKEASKDEVNFITLFRKGPSDLELRAKLSDHCVETLDGLCVNGESFFGEFQLDEEEDA